MLVAYAQGLYYNFSGFRAECSKNEEEFATGGPAATMQSKLIQKGNDDQMAR